MKKIKLRSLIREEILKEKGYRELKVNPKMLYRKGNIEIIGDYPLTGSSFIRMVSPDKQKKVLNFIKKLAKKGVLQAIDILYDIQKDKKYSESLIIKFDNKVLFTLYAFRGTFRFGAGGKYFSSARKLSKKVTDQFLKKI